ncbi:hypothetical protein OVA21_12505 [Dietzia sp. SL131]|uniref:hypothetical protein n=1 Tax=Dietzia sp. SL131 TaxID=2995149 RepID=UPI00227CCDAF|nr:hypothetical protein [Dietzia sp. SL131]MCY1658005.1 hypothetical protein [Dietzia sp. SL131]
MRESIKQPRILLALAGVLALLATLTLGAATMRPTEATWQDTVNGQSVFGADPAGIKSYARAISGNGVIKRPITSDAIGPARAVANPATRSASARLAYDDSGAFDVLPLEMSGNACAGVGAQQAASCGATATVPPAGSFAKSDVRNLKLWAAGIRGVQNVTFESSSTQAPITATATCVAGQTIEPRVSAGGPILLRGRTPLYLPPANRQTSATDRGFLSHNISGVLQVHQAQGPGWAKVEVRLHVENVYPLSDWTLHVVLASAECGIAQDMPAESPRPTTARPKSLTEAPNQPATATFASRTALRMSPEVEPTVESTTVLPTEDSSAIDGDTPESELPTLDDAASDRETADNSAATTTTSATPSPTTSTSATTTADATSTTSKPESSESSTTVPGTSEPASSESSVPTEEAAPETTEQTAVAEGPQDPEAVRVGQEFAVINREGVELGIARIDDIVRTPGCGVELALSIRTSSEAGPERWASIGPRDFAEVRAGGSTREATKLNSDCAQAANSTTTALSPGRGYEIVIAFQLDDSAQQAMLRPDGTAGWIFDLPPLPRVSVTTSPSSPATTESPTPDASAPTVESSVPTAEA